MNIEEINADYYYAIEERDGIYNLVKYYPFNASQMPKRIMQTLWDMVENSKYTIFDVQKKFANEYHRTNKYINWIIGNYSYSSAYLGRVEFPKVIDIKEYNEKKANYFRRKEMSLQQNIYFEEKDVDITLKEFFVKSACKYIKAYELSKGYDKLMQLPNFKLVSHGKIGWETIKYEINNDIVVTVLTNFGYGDSSYFNILITYKGIKLSPYSHVVRYYYANMKDIISCTRSYCPRSENWKDVSDFIIDISNNLKSGNLSYVKEWIGNEIQEMLKGLCELVRNPRKVIDGYIEEKPSNLVRSLKVRNINDTEKEEYKTYGDEFVIAYKAIKISNSLNLIESLYSVSGLYESAKDAVANIKHLCIEVLPEINGRIQIMEPEIASLNNSIKQKESLLNNELQNIRNHNKNIEKYYKPGQKPQDQKKIIERYEQEHPDYISSKEQVRKLSEELANLRKELYSRNNFLKKMQDSVELINGKAK